MEYTMVRMLIRLSHTVDLESYGDMLTDSAIKPADVILIML